jgi:translation initiation factor IF-2
MHEKIPYIVALTKIDKPNANLDKARQSLAENEIYVEGWGGTIPCVPISAITGEGIDELFDMITLISEMSELTYDPTELASGTVIESTLDSRKGISATLLLKNGELQVGAVVLSGSAFAPARFIEDFRGTKIQTATASMPVRILGWNKMPECGLTFTTVSDKKTAEKLAAQYENEHKKNPKPNADTMKTKDQTPDADEKEDIVIIPIVVKADVIGSLEGIKHELQKIKNDKVKIKLVSDSIGDINENDIKLAQGDPNIILIAFNVSPDKKAQAMIERSPTPIQFQSFNIIYELSNFLRETMTSKIPKEYVEEVTGRAKILALFSKDKDRQIVGGKVESGVIELGNDVRILRREIEIGRGKIRELQSKKIKAREVAEGFEFGTMIDAKIEIAAGDRVEAVHTVEKINK